MSAERRTSGLQQLVMVSDPQGAAAEAYRTLRTNLRFMDAARPCRTLSITSCAADEGKSTTLANLGVAAAQAGARVALLDCDLRRPTLHDIFGVPNTLGLTSLFLNATDRELPLVETSIPGLSIMPSGPKPPNPADLLASEQMERALGWLRDAFELVLLDAPPVALVADASILAPRVDGVLLVVDARHTRRDAARHAKAQLERVHAHIIGTVLNNAAVDRKSYG